jgi:acetyltransferase-like isoleucine patch superfamily enzyme
VIGANAVVVAGIPPFSLTVEVPAKIIKTLDDSVKVTS